jgi:hypothetical protein
MGERIQVRIYRGVSEPIFRQVASEVASKVGGAVVWDARSNTPRDGMSTAVSDSAISVYLPYLGGVDYLFCSAIAMRLNAVWMELRIQEGSLWDYSLYRGDTHLHNFSTLPTYWNTDRAFVRSQRGDVDQLVAVWGCDKNRVANYLRQWKMRFPWYSYPLGWIKWVYSPPRVMSTGHWYHRLFGGYKTVPRGKAYESDQHEYGDIWQMCDFMRALGAADPLASNEQAKSHTISLPDAKTFSDRIQRQEN